MRKKVRDKMGYIVLEDEKPVGVLRYNLFWDNTPFLTMIFIDWPYQKKGFGCKAVDFWEEEMIKLGYGMVMVSTQVNEEAQHFYRKLGYKDFIISRWNVPGINSDSDNLYNEQKGRYLERRENMPRGIIVFGAAGSGKTTLGKELARQLNFQHLDLDDYYWNWDTEVIPFTIFRPKEEIIKDLMRDISKYQDFVMSGSMGSIRGLFNPMFDLAAFVTVPTAIRMERLHRREFAMFGERILAGGDMYEQNIRFLNEAAGYDTGEPPQVCLKQHEQWAAELPCPVLHVDGTKDIAENAAWIAERFYAAG